MLQPLVYKMRSRLVYLSAFTLVQHSVQTFVWLEFVKQATPLSKHSGVCQFLFIPVWTFRLQIQPVPRSTIFPRQFLLSASVRRHVKLFTEWYTVGFWTVKTTLLRISLRYVKLSVTQLRWCCCLHLSRCPQVMRSSTSNKLWYLSRTPYRSALSLLIFSSVK